MLLSSLNRIIDKNELTKISSSEGATIGPNTKCACNSGKKFKKCHGAQSAPMPPVSSLPKESLAPIKPEITSGEVLAVDKLSRLLLSLPQKELTRLRKMAQEFMAKNGRECSFHLDIGGTVVVVKARELRDVVNGLRELIGYTG